MYVFNLNKLEISMIIYKFNVINLLKNFTTKKCIITIIYKSQSYHQESSINCSIKKLFLESLIKKIHACNVCL